MPIYEYACVSCEHQFETIQRISEDPLLDCPECGKPDLKKLVSVAAFRLKGAGWYETDFKSGEKKNIAGEEKKDGSNKSDEAGSTKSDAASDAAKGSVPKETAKSDKPPDSTKKPEPKASSEPKGSSSKNTSSGSSSSD